MLLACAWVFLFLERLSSDLHWLDGRLGDGMGLLGSLIIGATGVYAVSNVRLSHAMRWVVFAGLGLFILWNISDTLDEFAYFEGNPLLGQGQTLHIFIEALLLTSAGIVAWIGFVFGLIEAEVSRRGAQRETERAQEESDEHRKTRDELRVFHDAIENSHDAVFISNLDSVILYMNISAEYIFGYERKNVIGKSAEFFVERVMTHANIQSIVIDTLTHGGWTGELELNRLNGDIFVGSLTTSPILGDDHEAVGILTLVREVTEQRRLESALRASEELHRLLADNATDLISSHDIAGTFLYASPACRSMIGYPPEELVGHSVFDFLHQNDREMFMQLMTGRPHEDRRILICRAIAKDGRTVWIETALRQIVSEDTGDITEVIAVSRDISARREKEEANRILESRMQKVQKQESLSVLAGGVAHDYNNLLLTIMANAELASLELADDSVGAKHLQKIVTATERAAELTRQMLAYSGQSHISVDRIDLSVLVSDMIHLLESAISKKVRLHKDLPANLPAIEGDATQFRQVVMNLVTNASEATEDNDGSVLARTGTMTCSSAYLAETFLHEDLTAGEYVFLEISDTGPGMSPETTARIFEPFFTTKFTGRGLGLAALLGIVRAHRGAIDVKSVVGQGTVFRVLIPVAPSETSDTNEDLPPEPVTSQH